MNTLIRQTLEEHADDGPTPYVDVAAIEAAGRQRVRRRRVAGGVAALAVVAVVGVVTPYVSSQVGSDQGQVAIDRATSPTGQVSWSTGTTVQVGDRRVDLRNYPFAYVLNDDGIVWVDAETGVNLTDLEGRTEQIGTTTVNTGRVLVADGSLAAWYDGDAGRVTVFDTSTMTLVRRIPVDLDRRPGGLDEGPTVRAIADGVVWFYADREINGVDLSSGTIGGFDAPSSEGLGDARAGHLAVAAPPPGRNVQSDRTRILGPDGEEISSVPGGGRALLSPDATYVATDANDTEQVWDVASGAEVTPDFGYDFQAVVQWLDDDTYQALAADEVRTSNGYESSPVDFLVCTVSSGQCEVVADDVTDEDSGEAFSIPVGESVE